MAQAKLKDYFAPKKRNYSAKRRKTVIPFSDTEYTRSNRSRSRSDDGKKSPATNPLIPSDSDSELERDDVSSLSERSFSLLKVTPVVDVQPKKAVSLPFGKCKNRNQFSRSRGKRKTAASIKSKIHGQTKLTDLLSSSLQFKLPLNYEEGLNNQSPLNNDKLKDEINIEHESVILEEVTSYGDIHSSSYVAAADHSTPRKRICSILDTTSEESLPRKRKTHTQKQSPSKLQDIDAISDSTRKKLLLDPSHTPGPSKPEDSTFDDTDKEVNTVMTGKSQLLALVAEIIVPFDDAVSPLPATPERQEEVSSSPEPVMPVTPKLQNLSQKLKALTKMNGQALKNRLKQSGKLCDIQEKFGELDKAIQKVKGQPLAVETSVSDDVVADGPEKIVPAHQRFENLVEEGPPTLSLPFSYKNLEGAFQAMDLVVSMMHNRSEMCTFSKLKAAIQNMMKKNFEEVTVGQIKTIVPEAYIFRQENNMATFGKKMPGYQLTVEANLTEDNKSNGESDEVCEGKLAFTASALLKRKRGFRNNLLNYLKQLHKNFLASLKYPLSIPDDKLTRWHPQFQLDKVPDVVPSSLPQPPEVKVYHTAKDVLEKQAGKLNPRVEEALTRIVAENGNGSNQDKSQDSSISSLPASSPSLLQNTSSLKGIPPALLAKIRAKEAQKMEESLTRSPAEDRKTNIMSHLPEIIRILRTYFVTEKKPAIPLEVVYKKLQDSYRTGISQQDVEQHIDMLKELAPELVSVVEIKRGKFLKLDKNIDIQAVSNRILNLVKSRK